MKWPKFEDKIGQLLHQHRSEPDVDELWTAIEAGVDQINQEKKKRRPWFWVFLLGLPICAACISLIYFRGMPHSAPQPSQTSQGASKGPQTNIMQAESDITNAQDHLPVINSSLNTTTNSGSTISDRTLSLTSNAYELKLQLQNTFTSVTSPDHVNFEQHTEETFSILNPKSSIEGPGLSPSILPGIEVKNIKWDIAPLAIKEISQVEYTTEVLIPRIDCWKHKKANWFFLVEAGIGYTGRSLTTALTDSVPEALITKRNESETQLETVQAGLFVSRINRKGFEITAGINYTQINERFKFEEEHINVDYEYGIEAFVMNSNNQLDTIFGLVPLQTTVTKRVINFNNHKIIDLPIIVGYHRPLSRGKGSFGIRAGIFTNIYTQTEGKIFGYRNTNFEIIESDIYKPRIGLSYYTGLSLNYPLNDRIIISLAPSVRYFPHSFTKGDYPLRQRYQVYSFKGGLRFKLNK